MFGESIVLSHGVQQVFLQRCSENEKVEILATPNPSDGQFNSSNGMSVYSEEHTVESNSNGLVTLIIGEGVTSNVYRN